MADADADAPTYTNTFHPTHYEPASGIFYGYESMVPIIGSPNTPLSVFVMQPATAVAPFVDQQLLPASGYEDAVASYAASVAPTEQGIPFFDAWRSIPSPMPPVGYDQLHFHQTAHEQQVTVQYWQWHMDNHLAYGYGPFAGWTPHYVAPPPSQEHPVPLVLYVVPYQSPQQQCAIDYAHTAPTVTHETVASPMRAPRRFRRNMGADFATMSTHELLEFATTAKGESFLRDHYTADGGQRDAINSALFRPGVLLELSKNRYGNYIVQTLIENGGPHVVDLICAVLGDYWVELALDRYGSRVVQRAVEQFPVDNRRTVAHQFRGHERLLAVDGHASHVVVRLVETDQREMFQSFIDAFRHRQVLLDVVEQYHGSRVVVEVVRRLVAAANPSHHWRDNVELRDIVSPLIENAELYAMHEHANRVMQLLVACEQIPELRSEVVQAGIMGRVMQLSLTKFGSQVVEKALRSASPQELSDMCDEIVLPEKWSNSMLNRDALDVLAFDRYGNYVTQTLLHVYLEVMCGARDGDLDQFHRVAAKLAAHFDRLRELNSGQKIIQLLERMQEDRHIDQLDKMQEEQLLQHVAAAAENGVATGRRRDQQESSV